MHVLALDIGTSAVKAAVLDVTTAAPVGPVHKARYDLDMPTPDAAEVPADRLWAAITVAARKATAAGPAAAGVGMDCLTPALVLLDAADRPLAPIRTHLDRRSRPIARRVEADVGPEFLATTGNRPLPGGMSALSWAHWRDEHPDDAGRVRWYLHVNGWVGLRLTGERAFDPANASFTGLFNTVTDQRWSGRWCDYFGVRPDWLPPVADGAATLGPLRPDAAAELGVPAGVPVKLGTADTASALLAAGLKPGELLHSVGTTQVLEALTDRPAPDRRRLVRRLGVGPAFVHVAHNPVGGAALEWLHRLCFRNQPADQFFGQTVPAAIGRETAVRLDPPFLGGDRLEIEPVRAALRELALTTTREDVLAAVLAAMRDGHAAAVAALGLGDHFDRVVLTGGAAGVVKELLPEYAGAAVLDEAAARGVARLFREEE